MAKNQVPIVGAITGPMHQFASAFLNGGRSLHPLQRAGAVPITGYPSVGAAAVPGQGSGPPVAGPQLAMPPVLNPSITSAFNPATQV